jgi:Secretion system C-terminal sorting domain
MKKTIVYLFLILTSFAKAQDYQSVISQKSLWSSIDCFKIGTIEDKKVRKEMMQGDTIIAGLSYKKMYRDASYIFDWATAKYICAVRESDKKVYFVLKGETAEKLLYDFTKNKGDLVEVSSTIFGNRPVKLKIDSIFTSIINGIPRKTYQFNPNGSYHTLEYWYEGIGSSFGFLTPFISVTDNILTLKCKSKNDTLYYLKNNISNFLCSPNEPSNSCEYTKIATQTNEIQSFSLGFYPNPANDRIYIQENVENLNYSILGIDGKTTCKGTIEHNFIEIQNIPKGLYFVEIKDKYKLLHFKFVKQ